MLILDGIPVRISGNHFALAGMMALLKISDNGPL